MSAIFNADPDIGLDVFVLGGDSENDPIYGYSGPMRGSPVEAVEPAKLWEWADQDPNVRYPILGRALLTFPETIGNTTLEISPTYLEAMERAPDRSRFLSVDPHQLGPRGWSGNLSTILDRRRGEVIKLADHQDENVRQWSKERVASLKERADLERARETEREESFE